MKVIDIAQRTPEWLEWRKGGVSATSLAVIKGLNPQKSRRQLWLEIKGYATPPDLSVIPQVRKGAKFEPLALQAFEDKYGQIGLPICGEHEQYPWMRASFDGLLDGGQPVEIKNLAEGNHLSVLDNGELSDAYQLYQWQVKHQLVVAGQSVGWLWFWSPKHTPVCLVVKLEPNERQEIIEECRQFWDSIVNDELPDPDPARDPLPLELLSDDVRDTWLRTSEERKQLEREIKRLEKELNGLQEQAQAKNDVLRGLMGDYRSADYNGVRITQYPVSGRIDWQGIARKVADPATLKLLTSEFSGAPTQACRVTVNPDFAQGSETVIPIHLIKRKQAQRKAKLSTSAARLKSAFWF